jgi:hypothetical protein
MLLSTVIGTSRSKPAVREILLFHRSVRRGLRDPLTSPGHGDHERS